MASNLLLPLAAIPFLTRNLGLEVFGELAVAQAATLIICQIIEYGFSLGGSREASGPKLQKELDAIYSKYQNTKLLLFLVTTFTSSSLAYLELIPVNNTLFISMVIPASIGILLQSNWYFQGRGLFGWLAISNFCGKMSAFLISVFCIKSTHDTQLAGFAFGFGYLVAGFILAATAYSLKVKWTIKIELTNSMQIIKSSSYNFLSIAFLSLHTQFLILLTGHYINPKTSGILSIADKMVRGLSAIIMPIANTSFPVLSDLFSCDIAAGKKIRLKVSKILISYSILCSVFVYFFGPSLGEMIFKINDNDFLTTIKISALLPIFIAIGVANGGLTLIPAKLDFEYLVSIISAEALALVTFFVSLYFFKSYAGIIAITVAEGSMAILFYIFVRIRLYANDSTQGI